MPFLMKIQPIDMYSPVPREAAIVRAEPTKPVLKSRLKRLFDLQFPSVLRISSVEKQTVGGAQFSKDGAPEFEPSSVCLDKMVQIFIEESHNEKQQQSVKCGRNRCHCFNRTGNDSSDDEFDVFGESINGGLSGDTCDVLKSLIPCACLAEGKLLADTAMIVEKNKNHKRKDDLRKIVTDGLSSLGYDSSICKSKWEKTSAIPAGEYEYIDVVVEGERLLIDVDFRSEFEMARTTGTYKAIVQSLPYIFVGKPERLDRIVSIVSEAAKQSLTKKGMHLPPWRKAEYSRAKWLSAFTRASQIEVASPETKEPNECGELELIFRDEIPPAEEILGESESPSLVKNSADGDVTSAAASSPWQPPAVKPKSVERGTKMVTGLASLLKEKP
ncbi:hypothetical protein SLE2022_250140 [Rubroshorea leprosula]